MKSQILQLLAEYAEEEGTQLEFAMRDMLTECIHVCEDKSWSFAGTMAAAIEVFKEEKNGERGQYEQQMDLCPLCGSSNICNEDALDLDAGQLEVTCHDCSYQWVEPADLVG